MPRSHPPRRVFLLLPLPSLVFVALFSLACFSGLRRGVLPPPLAVPLVLLARFDRSAPVFDLHQSFANLLPRLTCFHGLRGFGAMQHVIQLLLSLTLGFWNTTMPYCIYSFNTLQFAMDNSVEYTVVLL
jgi:hypothetical protein